MWSRLMIWVERFPEWLRPPLIGAIVLAGWSTVRVVFLIPAMFASPRLALPAIATIGVSAIAGGVAGLIYSLIGRPLRRIPGYGRYLAGFVCVAAYLVPLGILVQYAAPGKAGRTPPELGYVILLLGFSAFLGVIVAHWLFKEPA